MPKSVILFLIFLLPSPAFAAGFDCARAATPVEKMICGDPDLSRRDGNLAASYSRALKQTSDPGALKKQQREWLADVRKRCNDVACLRDAYSLRITQLSLGGDAATQNPAPVSARVQSETVSGMLPPPGTPQVAAHYQVATIRPDGSLWVWGTKLGDSSDKMRTVPVGIGSGFVKVVVGTSHTLAIKSDGSLWGWGSNGLGQLGGESVDGRHPVKMGDGFIAIAASENYSFAVKNDGTLWAWGGLSTSAKGEVLGSREDKPTLLGKDYVSVSARDSHFAAIKKDGTLWMWGANREGQLGNGRDHTVTYGTHDYEEKPILVGSDFAQVSVGYSHTAAIKKDGTLWAWGFNGTWGKLGDGTTNNHNTPVKIGSGFAQVDAGSLNTVAVKTDGTLWAWGGNALGLFGDCTTATHLSPVKLGEGFIQAAAGQESYQGQHDFLVAIKNDGSVWTWGWQWDGDQVGVPLACRKPSKVVFGNGIGKWDQDAPASATSLVSSPLPAKDILSIAAGGSHTVMVKADGTLWTWGSNAEGQLGDGTVTSRNVPVRVGSGYTQASADHQDTMALKKDGTLWRWGFDRSLFLTSSQQQKFARDPDQLYQWSKKQKTALSAKEIYRGIVRFARSGYERGRGLGLKGDGTLWDWPYFWEAQKEPVKVGRSIMEYAAGEFGSFAIRTDGTLWRLQGYPVEPPIQIGSDFIHVVSGKDHAYGIKRDGSLWAWGANSANQLGDGSNADRADPVKIGTGFVQVATGLVHGLALKSDGSLWAWGQNQDGQLGDGGTEARNKPIQIGSGFAGIAAGDLHSVAVKTDGTVWAWGNNQDGQLGDGTNVGRLKPVRIGVANK